MQKMLTAVQDARDCAELIGEALVPGTKHMCEQGSYEDL